MRKVHPTEQVAHLWAHQSQSEARNNGGSVYFYDDVIYSYGSHFPMGRHVNGVVLLNSDSYSITTSKHQTYVSRACNHLTCFEVPDCMANDERAHRENFDDFQQRYENALLNASRARVYTDMHLRDAEQLLNTGNAYAQHFGFTWQMQETDIEALKEKAREQAAAQREARKQREAELKQRYANETAAFPAALERWRNGGERPRLSYSNPDKVKLAGKGAFLRVVDDTVETSQGANFPTSYVANAWRIVSACFKRGTTFKTNGEIIRLGHFRLDSVDANGNVKAGCHYVEYAECERLARTLGLTS